jgi:hypothetical protein
VHDIHLNKYLENAERQETFPLSHSSGHMLQKFKILAAELGVRTSTKHRTADKGAKRTQAPDDIEDCRALPGLDLHTAGC